MVSAHTAFHAFMKDKQSLVHHYKEAVRSALVSNAANDAVGTKQAAGAVVISRTYKASHLKTGPNDVQYVSGRPEYTTHACPHATLVRSEFDALLRTGSLTDFLTQYVVHAPVNASGTEPAAERAGVVSSFCAVLVDGQPRNVRFSSVPTHYRRSVMPGHVLTFAGGASSCANVMLLRLAPTEGAGDADVWEALVVFGRWSKCFSKIILPPAVLGDPQEDDGVAGLKHGAATKRYLSEKFPAVRYFLSDPMARNDESIPFVKGLLHTMVRLRWAYTAITSIGAAMLHEKKLRSLFATAREPSGGRPETTRSTTAGKAPQPTKEDRRQILTALCKDYTREFDQAVRTMVRQGKKTEAGSPPGIEDCTRPGGMMRFLVAAAERVTDLYDELMQGAPNALLAQEQLHTLRVGHEGEHGYGHHCLVRILEETPVFLQTEPKKLGLKKREVLPVMVIVWKADPFKLATCLTDTWVVKLHYCAYSQRYLNMAAWVSVDSTQRPAWAQKYNTSDFAEVYNPGWHTAHGDHSVVIPLKMSLLQKAEFYVEKPVAEVQGISVVNDKKKRSP